MTIVGPYLVEQVVLHWILFFNLVVTSRVKFVGCCILIIVAKLLVFRLTQIVAEQVYFGKT